MEEKDGDSVEKKERKTETRGRKDIPIGMG